MSTNTPPVDKPTGTDGQIASHQDARGRLIISAGGEEWLISGDPAEVRR